MEPVLAVEQLETEFVTNGGVFKAVDGVSFHVHQGETLGVVGESGCGKSVTSLSIMGLLPKKIGRAAAPPMPRLAQAPRERLALPRGFSRIKSAG